MKYCMNYYRTKVLGETGLTKAKPDELKIKYRHNTSEILDFAADEKWSGIRLLVDFTEYENEEDFNEIKDYIFAASQKHIGGFAIIIPLEYAEIRSFAEEKHIDYFFDNPCTSEASMIDCLTHYNVSDIYVTDELCFSLPSVAEYAHKLNVKIRVYPNIIQTSANWTNTKKDFLNFFIRPEDVYLYESLVDVMEFVCEYDRQPTYFKIYRQGYWKGNIDDIILGLEVDLPNEAIMPDFGNNRLDCHIECMRQKTGRYKCRHCILIQELAESMKKSNLTISIKKDN